MIKKQRFVHLNNILIALLAITFINCSNNDVRPNLLIKRDEKGNVIEELPYIIRGKTDTLLNGVVKYYYPNRKISDSFNVTEGMKDGYYHSFYENGNIKSVYNFKNDKLEGVSFSFYENGKIEVEEMFSMNDKVYYKSYYPDGTLKTYFIFENKEDACYLLVNDSLGNKKEESGDSLSCRKKANG